MKIAINALSSRTGGGAVYLRNLIRSLLEIKGDDSYVVFATRENRKRLIPQRHERLTVLEVNVRRRFFRLLYEQLVLPVRLVLLRADVLFAPAEIVPLLSHCPVVLGLQNLNVYSRGTIRWPLTDRLRNGILFVLAWISVRRASESVFFSRVSQFTISRALHIDPKEGVVVHHGVDPLFRSSISHEPSGGIRPILCVSAVRPHKNLECLIEAYGGLASHLQGCHPLVIAGSVNDHRYYGGLASRLRVFGVDPKDVFLGDLSLDRVATLYRQAAVVVLPSLHETFGLPLVEAMASGAPVIAADASSIPEIVGDAAELFDPQSPDALRASIEALLSDERKRSDLISKGYWRAEQFTWSKAAARMLEVFSVAAGSHGTGNPV